MVNINEALIFPLITLLLVYSYFTMEQNYTLLYIFLAVFLAYSFISIYVSRKYGAKIIGWPTIIRLRDYTSLGIALPEAALIFNAIFVFYNGIFESIPLWVGFMVMLVGMGFNILVRKDLGKNWVPLSKTTEDQELITEGVYSRVRHPFYTSISILFGGITIIAWNLYGLLFFVLFLIALIIRIKKEEKELIAKFNNEYERYKKETPMLLPKLWRS